MSWGTSRNVVGRGHLFFNKARLIFNKGGLLLEKGWLTAGAF